MRRSTIGMLALGALAAAAGLAVLLLSARGPDARSRFDGLSPDDVLMRVQRAMSEKGSYRIEIVGQNLVLPRWGGVDSGTVDVKLDGSAVSARLQRTGDGLYRMRLVDGQTYFQRITCDTLARVPGGGADVLAPFVLSGLALTARDSGQRIDNADGPPIIGITVPRLGQVALELDPDSYLPVSLKTVRLGADDAESSWEFSGWGDAVVVDPPPGAVPDQGPGGDPC